MAAAAIGAAYVQKRKRHSDSIAITVFRSDMNVLIDLKQPIVSALGHRSCSAPVVARQPAVNELVG